jgi:hypothetical protein
VNPGLLNATHWRLHPAYSDLIAENCDFNFNFAWMRKEGGNRRKKKYKECCKPWLDAILSQTAKRH